MKELPNVSRRPMCQKCVGTDRHELLCCKFFKLRCRQVAQYHFQGRGAHSHPAAARPWPPNPSNICKEWIFKRRCRPRYVATIPRIRFIGVCGPAPSLRRSRTRLIRPFQPQRMPPAKPTSRAWRLFYDHWSDNLLDAKAKVTMPATPGKINVKRRR